MGKSEIHKNVPPLWILTDLPVYEVPAELIAIGTSQPFYFEDGAKYLEHVPESVMKLLEQNITGERGERILVSAIRHWRAAWVLFYGLGEREALTISVLKREFQLLVRDISKLKVNVPGFFLPPCDRDPQFMSPEESAQILMDSLAPPVIIVSPHRKILNRIQLGAEVPTTQLLKEGDALAQSFPLTGTGQPREDGR